MSTFEVKIYKIEKIEPHPDADFIELAVIGEYRSIIQKNTMIVGDLIAYIPEASIVPDWILDNLNLTGKLAGGKRNRVKAVRLRGVISQGICLPVDRMVPEKGISNVLADKDRHHTVVHVGQDVTELLGITKYEPPIPSHMGGEVFNAFGMTPKYDIENWKKWPNVINDGEMVCMTEKLHGTWCGMGYHPNAPHQIITSKGLSGRGVAFKLNDANEFNIYVRQWKKTIDDNGDDITTRFKAINKTQLPFYILGELYGKGIQDLSYGNVEHSFRVFDIYIGEPGSGRYMDHDELVSTCKDLDLAMVPVLYKGPFSVDELNKHTNGKETISGNEAHIREGIVIRTTTERRDIALGRVQLKSVSDKYLTRKNATEFN